jgi:hypothetical protein
MKGFLNISPPWVYFTLVTSSPSITLPYPFISHPPFSAAFNTHPDILCLHRCYVLWHYWCSITLFSFPSFPKFHRVVLLLKTYSTYEFIYGYVVFVYMFIFWIFYIWEKTCGLWLSEPGLLYLTWCPPIASIDLQTTRHYSLWLSKTPLCVYTTFS